MTKTYGGTKSTPRQRTMIRNELRDSRQTQSVTLSKVKLRAPDVLAVDRTERRLITERLQLSLRLQEIYSRLRTEQIDRLTGYRTQHRILLALFDTPCKSRVKTAFRTERVTDWTNNAYIVL